MIEIIYFAKKIWIRIIAIWAQLRYSDKVQMDKGSSYEILPDDFLTLVSFPYRVNGFACSNDLELCQW